MIKKKWLSVNVKEFFLLNAYACISDFIRIKTSQNFVMNKWMCLDQAIIIETAIFTFVCKLISHVFVCVFNKKGKELDPDSNGWQMI